VVQESAIDKCRYFLKDTVRRTIDFSRTDQGRGVPPPPVEKPFDASATRLKLPAPGQWHGIGSVDLASAIRNRRSRRGFSNESLTLDELSFLLWATQGISERIDRGTALRTVPSAGARHALETYSAVVNVQGLDQAVYRYLPVEHELLLEFPESDLRGKLLHATFGQAFLAKAAVTFVWTTLPYRMEWRYGLSAHKVIAIDAGHVCQNLYLACEAIGAGTCAVGAYHQELMDQLLRIDGKDEFAIYLAPVGKV